MTFVKLTSKEGEGPLSEEEEIRKWCNENKKYISTKMFKLIIENELTLELLLSADRNELKDIGHDLGFSSIEKLIN